MPTLQDIIDEETSDEIERAERQSRREKTKYGHLLPDDE